MPVLSVIWRSAGSLLAMHARDVVEVLPPLASRPAPAVPDWVRGLFVFRGRLIPLVDCATLLGASSPPDRMMNRVLVARVVAGDERLWPVGNWPVGIWVESVLDIGSIDFDAADAHPGLASPTGKFLGPVAQTRWGLVQLVRPSHLFAPDQIDTLIQRLEQAAT
ncbi:MAG: chemotaxis protein CheW [Phycisphaerales bacterium]|nr:chemotaxis protein CheW [Phycisphaerales bacterium]